ncbi:MAG: glycosyltransferase family 2 protein [bacterium]|nr:glycosyltransferase family 2 protein [bacterium]
MSQTTDVEPRRRWWQKTPRSTPTDEQPAINGNGSGKINGEKVPESSGKVKEAEKIEPVTGGDAAVKTTSKEWGYGFVVAILVVIFGSITIATYIILLRSQFSVPNIIVNVSIISLLLFLFVLIARYLSLIFLSYLHHSREKASDEYEYPLLKVSVLVPAYNEGPVIAKSVQSLLALDYPNYEIVVIDDGSKDDTLAIARTMQGRQQGVYGPVEVKVLTQVNKGKSHALNHGARDATGEVVVCMDGDSKLAPETLRMAMRHFVNPKIAAVAGNVKVVNRVNLLTRLQALEYIEGLNLARRAQAFLQSVNIIPGPIGLFRKTALVEVGGWEADTFAEDCDLTLKLITHGYKVDYEPYAISYTEAPEKLLQLLKQRYRWTRGILQSLRKHRKYLFHPGAGWRVVGTMWQMIVESVLWPGMNTMANLLFIIVAIIWGMSPLIVLWWVQLTILDTIAAMHSVAMEKEQLRLVPLAVIYRFFFIQLIDMAKLMATVEEMLGIKMSWGKLERVGRL